MANRIIIKKITHNTIFVTWQIDGCCGSGSTKISPPFIMTSDGSAIPFMMSIVCNENFTISIEQATGEAGRASVCLAVTNNSYINSVKIYFTEKWETKYLFCDIGRFLPYAKSYAQNPGTYPTTNLKIDCKITWFGFVGNVTIPKLPLSPLSIVNLPFDNSAIPDFIIIVGAQELLAHKAILARNSPVLLAMFESPMTESKENKMIIEDLEYSTMELLLRIMYTGESETLNDVDTALAVLEAAEKYEMSTIKSLCECKLQLRVRADNVLMLLEKADKYNALQLCETCIAYIMAVKDDKISCEFQKISQKPNIGIAFMNALTDQLSLIPLHK